MNEKIEHIIIKNFLCIKEADININYYTILIGEQAAGKSLIARVIYLCRKILTDVLFDMAISRNRITSIRKKVEELFFDHFQNKDFLRNDFSIEYKYGDLYIKIFGENGKFKVEYSEEVKNSLNKLKKIKLII